MHVLVTLHSKMNTEKFVNMNHRSVIYHVMKSNAYDQTLSTDEECKPRVDFYWYVTGVRHRIFLKNPTVYYI